VIKKKTEYTFLILLFAYSLYCSLIIGTAWDEFYHYKNGDNIFRYIFSLGQRDYVSANFIYHYGFYDFLAAFFSKNFTSKYLVEAHHLLNLFFSIFSVFGIYQLTKKMFNSKVGKITFLICFLNPVFFGHFSINPKDTIVAFSYIWIFCISLKYLEKQNNQSKKNTYLFYLTLLFSLGLGIRLTFLISLIPIFIILFFEIYKNKKNFFSISRFLLDIFYVVIFSFIITIIFWPDTHSDLLRLPFIYIKNYFVSFFSSNFGLQLGLLNAQFYDISNTPRSYIYISLFHKMPIYMLISFIFLPFVLFNKKFINKFNISILNCSYVLFQIFFILLLLFIFKPGINDGVRYFLYLIPLLSIISGLCIYYIYKSKLKIIKFFTSLLILLNILIFFSLTPYQYIFINNLNGYFSSNLNKYENDYWGTSIKELIIKTKIKKVFEIKKNYLIATCGLNQQIVKYYLNKYTDIQYKFVSNQVKYDYIIFINRVDNNSNSNLTNANTCYNEFYKNDIVSIKRNDLQISFISN
jgi:hypothetical protein